MHKLVKSFSAIALFTTFLSTPYAVENDKAIAEVNGEPIMATELLTYAKVKNPQANLQEQNVRTQLLKAYIGRELLFQEAMRQKYDEREIVKIALENQRREVISQALIATILTEKPITDAQVRAYYDNNFANRKEVEYKVSHILVSTEAEANDVIARLNKGEDFAKVAQAVSTDSSAARGGELGWMHTSKMPAAFGESVKNTDVGKHSAKPAATTFGFHVILVEQSRPIQVPPFEQVSVQIKQSLTEQLVQNYIAELQKKAKIELMN